MKRSSRRTRGLLFIHDHVRMPLSRDMCRSLLIFPADIGMRNIYHYFTQRTNSRAMGIFQIKRYVLLVLYYRILFFNFMQIFSTMYNHDLDRMYVYYIFTVLVLKQRVS